MAETTQNEEQPDGPPNQFPYQSPGDEEVSILDLLLVLAEYKEVILRTVLAFTLLGVAYALLAPTEYTSSARVVRETQEGVSQIPSGLSSLRGLGINIGGAPAGLTPEAFPSVLQSREVQLAVAKDTFFFPDVEERMTFIEYANQPPTILELVLDYTIHLPWTIKASIGEAASDQPSSVPSTTSDRQFTKDEFDALEMISEMVTTSVDDESGLMSLSVTADGSQLASDMANSFVEHLTRRIRQIRTKKTRERLNFVQDRFKNAEGELRAAEENLARFLERNQDPTTATLRFQRDRLQRQVQFKEQLYSELQGQLTQARLDLQRRQPVVTVVEEPVAPVRHSSPQRTRIVLLCFAAGSVLGIGRAFFKNYIDNQDDEEERRKIRKVRDQLIPERWSSTVN